MARSESSQHPQRDTFTVPATVDVEHTADSLHAYVDLEGDIDIRPGDEVTLNGAPIMASFGERFVLHRVATVKRASWLKRQFTRFMARFELTELYEVSFTPRRRL